jgi:Family of unknown function (DUF6159)
MNILSTVDQQSWQLLKASVNVMLRNRKLFWFAILGVLLSTLMALFFLAPIALHPTGYHLDQKEHWLALKKNFLPLVEHPSPLISLYLLAVYFGTMFLTTFFNVAFYSEIIAALNGRGVSVRRGLSLARSRLPSIFAWTLLAGAVGWIINRIEQRLPFAARIVTGFIGMAWSVAAVFAIPVIIQEPTLRSPVRILRQSALALKKTWGESLNGYAGCALGGLAMVLWIMVPFGVAHTPGLPVMSIWFEIMAGIIWVLGLVFLGCLSGVVTHVYRCALYVYATEGVVPEFYNQQMLDMAWKVKKSSEKR